MKQEPKRRYETGIQLRPASIEEAGLFYSQVDADEDLSSGTVGHIRMDFGHGGKEFWHTWWPHNDDQFNTQEFKADLQTIIDALRTEGPLRDLATMRSFCNQNGGKITDDGRSFGYVVDTEHYRYCLRCIPVFWQRTSRPIRSGPRCRKPSRRSGLASGRSTCGTCSVPTRSCPSPHRISFLKIIGTNTCGLTRHTIEIPPSAGSILLEQAGPLSRNGRAMPISTRWCSGTGWTA